LDISGISAEPKRILVKCHHPPNLGREVVREVGGGRVVGVYEVRSYLVGGVGVLSFFGVRAFAWAGAPSASKRSSGGITPSHSQHCTKQPWAAMVSSDGGMFANLLWKKINKFNDASVVPGFHLAN